VHRLLIGRSAVRVSQTAPPSPPSFNPNNAPVLVAEVVQHFFPKIVELHNYSAANSLQQKLYNWNTLNTKLFRKLGFQLPREEQTK